MRSLQVFCEVAERGSFSRAADALALTQSAVSQHVASLERAVGVALIDRGTRPLELTEAGALLARHGRVATARLAGAEQELAELTGRLATRLRFGSFPTALATFVPDALRQLRARRPDLVLTVVDDHLQALLPRLERGEVDLALVYDHPSLPADGSGRLNRVTLFDDRYVALLPTGHRLARRRTPLGLRDLAEETWVGGRAGSSWYRIVAHECRRQGVEPTVSLTTDDHRAVQSCVAAGLGVAVVPGLAGVRPLTGVVVRPIDGDGLSRRISVASPAGVPVATQARALVDLLTEVTAPWREVSSSRRAGRPRP